MSAETSGGEHNLYDPETISRGADNSDAVEMMPVDGSVAEGIGYDAKVTNAEEDTTVSYELPDVGGG